MDKRFHRLTLLTGERAALEISKTKAAVVGLGGVGSWCAEALARSGIGSLVLIDSDTVCTSNINRQVQALESTLGKGKAAILAERIKDINLECRIKTITDSFFMRGSPEETARVFCLNDADYIIDAIDSIKSKLELIVCAFSAGKILFSSMGMAYKLDPSMIRVSDIWKTKSCPLAKLVRCGLRELEFSGHFLTVYSEEKIPANANPVNDIPGEKILGSAVTVTASAGMMLASLVINDICSRFSGKEPL